MHVHIYAYVVVLVLLCTLLPPQTGVLRSVHSALRVRPSASRIPGVTLGAYWPF